MSAKKPAYCCETLAQQVVDENGNGAGLHSLQVVNFKTMETRIAAVFNRQHRKRGKNDKGLCLNFCPWCGTDLVKFYGMKAKAQQLPRANPPICWICDRMLQSRGRVYSLVVGEDGKSHPAHKDCAANHKPEITVQPRSEGT